MKIERWFQGMGLHNATGEGYTEPGPGMTDCLGSVIGWSDYMGQMRAAQIIDRLFPGRLCDCHFPAYQIIHFNNHPETTREDVDKVLRVYTEELESARDLG